MYKILNKTYTKLPIEEEEQKELIIYLRKRYKNSLVYSNNNENKHSFRDRFIALKVEAKLKAMGKLKGIPDVTAFLDDYIFFIELKRQRPILKNGNKGTPTNKPTKEQLNFIEKSNTFKYCKSFIAYGCDEAIEIIQNLQKKF